VNQIGYFGTTGNMKSEEAYEVLNAIHVYLRLKKNKPQES
jgi:hypothetical protein